MNAQIQQHSPTSFINKIFLTMAEKFGMSETNPIWFCDSELKQAVREHLSEAVQINSEPVNPCSQQQEVINILRDWVFERDGKPFCMNDIFNDPELSGRFERNIRTMCYIDSALLVLRCSFNHDEDASVTFAELKYTPPKIKRVKREELFS
ncbi:hypothetical protein [Nitrosomonas sp.]|uniref:hypothetical protein n=1 Tax=Nitrosomonas sp. TaxID=42353 RepID=UPI0025D5B364|nr:hypothetical protein [Nitrosomonas sp.]